MEEIILKTSESTALKIQQIDSGHAKCFILVKDKEFPVADAYALVDANNWDRHVRLVLASKPSEETSGKPNGKPYNNVPFRRFVVVKHLEQKGKKKVLADLSPEEEQVYREFGYIPVQWRKLKGVKTSKAKVRGNPILKLRCDVKTLHEIQEFQKTLVNFNLSETVRYLILKGLQYSRNAPEVKLKLPSEVYERLEEHRKLFNQTEGLNLTLGEFIQLILERVVGLADSGQTLEMDEGLEGYP